MDEIDWTSIWVGVVAAAIVITGAVIWMICTLGGEDDERHGRK